jgi:ribosome biogenesis GTPase A
MSEKLNINWYPGHMAKTRKQIIDDLNLIDIVIELVDSRCPLTCLNPDLEQYTKKKTVIVALNKSDLADDEETKKWINYFESKGQKAIALQSNQKKGTKELINLIKDSYDDTKFVKQGRIGKTIKVMIIGIPNVGKSTLINSLANRNVAKAANKPGVTVTKQWISIDDKIELLDEPGMLWPKLATNKETMNLSFINSISDNAIDKQEIAYNLLGLLLENYPKNVVQRYDIDIENKTTLEVMNMIALKRGAILSGGRINEQKLCDIILTDFQTGKIGKITLEKVNK